MKRKLCSFVLAVALLFQAASFRPRQAHAIIGAATGDVPMIVIGCLYLGLGVAAFTYSAVDTDGFRRFDHYLDSTLLVLSVGAVLSGIVFLDESTGTAAYGPLSEELITGAQLTEDEVMAYQLELPELNRALYATAGDLAERGARTMEDVLTHDDAWQARAAGLMPETRSALVKLGSFLAARTAHVER